MNVSFASGADGNVNTNIVLPGFSYVTFIELNSVTYANGKPGSSPRASLPGRA